jgi:hypothetical protein
MAIFSKDYDFNDDIMLLSRIGDMKREVKIGYRRLDVAYMTTGTTSRLLLN